MIQLVKSSLVSFWTDKEKRQNWLVHLFPIFLVAALGLWSTIMSRHTVYGNFRFTDVVAGLTLPIVVMWHIMLIFLSRKWTEYFREILYAAVSIPVFFYIWINCMGILTQESI